MLFNLSADVSESVNLAPGSPDIVARLMARLATLAETMVEPMQWFPPFQARIIIIMNNPLLLTVCSSSALLSLVLLFCCAVFVDDGDDDDDVVVVCC